MIYENTQDTSSSKPRFNWYKVLFKHSDVFPNIIAGYGL